MLLLSHLLIVCISLGFSTFTFFSPSLKRIHLNYAFILGVVVSGVILALQNPAHLPQSCLSGLAYLGVVIFALTAAKRKLAPEISHD